MASLLAGVPLLHLPFPPLHSSHKLQMIQLQHITSGLNCSSSVRATKACRGIVNKTSTTAMDSGYPLDWFMLTPTQNFICEICGKVLNCPKSTSCCGNSFCSRCLDFWSDYYGICPKRCGEIELDSLRKENKLEKIIQSLPVHCQYSTSSGGGCSAKITLADKPKHEKRCPHKPKTSSNPAPDKTSKKDKTTSPSAHGEKQDTYVEMASVAAKTRAEQPHIHPSPTFCSTAPQIGIGGLVS